MTTIKLIGIDVDGTLLKNRDQNYRAFVLTQLELGVKPCTLKEYRTHYSVMRPDLFLLNLGFTESFLQQGQVRRIMSIFRKHYVPIAKKVPLCDGVKDALTEVRREDVRCVIVSNGTKAFIENECVRHGLQIDDVLSFEDRNAQLQDVLSPKRPAQPSKQAFLENYIAQHKIAPENVVVIGDTDEEVMIARNIGGTSIALLGGFHTRERLSAIRPDHLVGSWKQIPDIVRATFHEGGPR